MQSSTRDQLVSAATRLLDEGGPEAVTLRAVAHAVGVSHNAPYRHFQDKRALLSAVAQAGFRELGLSFLQATKTAPSPLMALRNIIGLYLSFARQCPARYRLLFNDPDVGREQGPLEHEALRTFGLVAGLVDAAQQSGELRPGDPFRITALLYGTIHGLADLELSGRTRAAKGMEAVEELPVMLLDMLSVAEQPRVTKA